MGKARQTRQGIMIRFDENDAELVEWLGQFAQSQTMTKVVKLACYMMAGLPIPDPLHAVAPGVAPARVQTYDAPPGNPPLPHQRTRGRLAGVTKTLAALREAVTSQQAPRDPSPGWPGSEAAYAAQSWDGASPGDTPPEEGGSREVAASGLDFSRPRHRRARPVRPDPSVPSFSPPMPVFDAQRAQEQLLMSIRGYGKRRT